MMMVYEGDKGGIFGVNAYGVAWTVSLFAEYAWSVSKACSVENIKIVFNINIPLKERFIAFLHQEYVSKELKMHLHTCTDESLSGTASDGFTWH